MQNKTKQKKSQQKRNEKKAARNRKHKKEKATLHEKRMSIKNKFIEEYRKKVEKDIEKKFEDM